MGINRYCSQQQTHWDGLAGFFPYVQFRVSLRVDDWSVYHSPIVVHCLPRMRKAQMLLSIKQFTSLKSRKRSIWSYARAVMIYLRDASIWRRGIYMCVGSFR